MPVYYDDITIIRARSENSAAVAYLTNQKHTFPCDTAGNVQTYAGGGTLVVIYENGVEMTDAWTISRADSAGVASTIIGNRVQVDALSANIGFVEITCQRGGFSDIVLRMELDKSIAPAGSNPGFGAVRGAIQMSVQVEFASWDSPTAVFALKNAGYGAPQDRDIVTLYNGAVGFSQTRYFADGLWMPLDAYIGGNLLVEGAIEARHIGADTINATMIVSKSATSFDYVSVQNGGNGAFSITFNMDHAGVAMAIVTVTFDQTGTNLQQNLSIAIDGQNQSGVAGTGYDVGQLTAMSQGTGLIAGKHNINIYASTSGATFASRHQFMVTILKSYR